MKYFSFKWAFIALFGYLIFNIIGLFPLFYHYNMNLSDVDFMNYYLFGGFASMFFMGGGIIGSAFEDTIEVTKKEKKK